jgi:FMN phosphatase YigB (HAD superfamily)
MKYALKTVDVWDTLIRRRCHPECIKLGVAHFVFYQWHSRLRPSIESPSQLYKERLAIESLLADQSEARGFDNEYDLSDVTTAWLHKSLEGLIEAELVSAVINHEVDREIDATYPDPDIERFLEQFPSERTIFLSDFYMSAPLILKILSANGMDRITPNGVSSCDIGLNKRSGRLFNHISTLHNVKSSDHVHVGDNEWSDLVSPQKLGIQAHRFLPEREHSARLEKEQLFTSRDALFHNLRTESFASAATSESYVEGEQNIFNFGIQMAPLFIGFMLFLAERAALEKLDKLFFFTREGEFFYEVFSRLFPKMRFQGLKLPCAQVLETSRFASFAATLNSVSVEGFSSTWRLHRKQNVTALFELLGLNLNDFSALLKDVGLLLSETVSDPHLDPRVKRLFADPRFQEKANAACAEQRSVLLGFLKEKGLTSQQKIGVIDIGWRGSIQDNLATICPNVQFQGYYLGMREFLVTQQKNTLKTAYAASEIDDPKDIRFFESFAVLEMLCMSPHGSVMGYEKHPISSSQPVTQLFQAVRKIDSEENLTFHRFAKFFQAGVLHATDVWALPISLQAVSSKEMRGLARNLWSEIQNTPPSSLPLVFAEGAQQDALAYGGSFERHLTPNIADIFLSPILSTRRRVLADFVRRIQWRESVRAMQGLGFVNKWLLLRVFDLANLIRRSPFLWKKIKRLSRGS